MTLEQLLVVPEEQRDQSWENKFFVEFSNCQLKVLNPEPQTGPDGWPYLAVETTLSGNATDEVDSAQKILSWLETRGIGLVVNPTKSYPDYVFTYGMIWYFRKTGLFYSPSEKTHQNPRFSSSEDLKVKSLGEPSNDVVPTHVRKILKNFLMDQGILMPQWQMVSEGDKRASIAFSLESLGSPPEKEFEGILEAISWFLPSHFSIMILSSKDLPGFVAI